MSENTTTNGTEKVKIPTCLEGAKARFEARKEKAKDADISKALANYCVHDDAIRELQEKIEDLKSKRTEATKELVSLRGVSVLKSKVRGQGRIVARETTAWIAFESNAEGPAY